MRILIVEDSETDAKLIAHELARGGDAVEARRVEDESAMRAALAEESWDLVVSDWSLPCFTGLEALAVLEESRQDVPFIIVSGTIGEDAAVDAMRAGAHDYVPKDKLTRLGAAANRELRERDVRASRRRAEQALRASEERYRRIVETCNEGVWIIDAEDRTSFVNARMARMLGCEPAEVLGRPIYDFVFEDRRAAARRLLDDRRAGAAGQTETRLRRKDGSFLWALIESSPIFDEDGRYEGSLGMVMDVTERKRAEDALRASEQRLATIYRLTVAAVLVVRLRDRVIVEVNDAFTEQVGWSREDVLGRTTEDLDLYPDPGTRDCMYQGLKAAARLPPIEARVRRKSGEVREFIFSVVSAEIGGETCALGVGHDVTELHRADAARRESEERLRQVVESIREVFWLRDVRQNRTIYVSPSYERIWGRPYVDAPDSWAESVHPDDRDRILRASRTKQVDGGYDEQYRIVRPDGCVRWIRDRAVPVRDASGDMARIAGVAEDITERRGLEEQLVQAQKMEAIGSLAGGVAHDFNNLLSVILSCSELLRSELPGHEEVEEIEKAARRAADLTRQLLAFSRRQMLQPRIVDLNQIVGGVEKMLKRLIGEDVELSVVVAGQRAAVYVDPGQIEQVIMNLAVNARDAMPNGGKLILQVARVAVDGAHAASHAGARPGPHVMLAVSDTGTGMDAATQSRIFEPFFTTKDLGKGTGLGLSTVFGIVRQSSGAISVHSEPGGGSTFQIYLPAADGATEHPQQRSVNSEDLRGSELILLVEDEDGVRRVVRSILERAGYRVLEAQNGGEALRIAASQPTVDLVITDVVMPGMSGPQLSSRLHFLRPTLKILYMSGYAGDAVVAHGLLRTEISFLQKPVTPSTLLTKVREVLDADA